MSYYVKIRGKAFGPFENVQIQGMIKSGQIGRNNEISQDRINWMNAGENEEFFPKNATPAQSLPQNPYSQPQQPINEPPINEPQIPGLWYYSIDGQAGFGPVAGNAIVQLIQTGQLRADSLIWQQGQNAQQLKTIPIFSRYFTPPFPSPNMGQNYQANYMSPPYNSYSQADNSDKTGYLDVLQKYAQFEGRSRRKEYWWFQLINLFVALSVGIVSFFLILLVGTLDDETASPILVYLTFLLWGVYIIYCLAIVVPGLALLVRRLHDTGNSGWLSLLLLIGIGQIILLIFCLMDSQPGSNKYGPNPKGM
ncbi:MAG: DUF805 domain-containing protein [Planctomycetaceae bacterium]|jgi:uncharacterized membrane protein YhaH (DUF805 family)|nr:DUF805 domain-containing protein [Planctomycetaceae bacterium]